MFSPEEYITRKAKQIADYLKQYDIQHVVLGLSGGVDSAVVMHLLVHAKELLAGQFDLHIHCYSLPFSASVGVTGQSEAVENAKKVAFTTDACTFLYHDIQDILAPFLDLVSTKWGEGQLASILRYVFLAGVAIRLQEQGQKAIVFGTINKTEYEMGYWGKWSDALPDYQPIMDIHKSEVFALAEYFGLHEVISRAPTGDVWDGRTDEQVMGAPYEKIEAFLRHDYGSLTADEFRNLCSFWRANSWKHKLNGVPGIVDKIEVDK